jgi:hypothetical protein
MHTHESQTCVQQLTRHTTVQQHKQSVGVWHNVVTARTVAGRSLCGAAVTVVSQFVSARTRRPPRQRWPWQHFCHGCAQLRRWRPAVHVHEMRAACEVRLSCQHIQSCWR